ncbi:MAG: VWA domain-containing protein [Acidimicrobiales bacterium]
MKLRTLSLVLVVILLAAACGDDTEATGPEGATTTLGGDRGWLEGDGLEWLGGSDRAGGDLDMASEADLATADGEFTDIGPIEPPIDDSPLRAGSIDDGDDVDAYLDYRARIIDSGIDVRELDLRDSTVFTVVGNNGLPVLDAVIELWDPTVDRAVEAPIVTLRTTADGSVRFAPGAMAEGSDALVAVVRVGDTSVDVEFERGAPSVDVTVDAPGGVDGSVPLDIHFVLDATGSMGDEISRLRDNMTSVATQIAALPSAPDVRFGMTVYRDEGDLFVTRTFDLTDDLQSFLDALADVQADGGGDYPEALDEALADALDKPAWRRDGAVELVFLIADAPPQIDRAVQQPSSASAIAAAEAGVKIFPVAASGTDDQAEYVMRELAFVTGGRFVFLSYGVDGSSTATGDRTDITADDYDELPLDALVVRLVQDELSALTGDDAAPVPTTTAPITTTTYEQ